MPDSSKPTGSTSTSVTAPGMNDILGAAKYLFNSGGAWAPDTTSHVTPFSTQTNQALTGLQNFATKQAVPLTQQNLNRVSATLSDGGLDPLQREQTGRLEQIAGGNGLNTMQQQGADWLKSIAGGGEMNGNPYLDAIIGKGSQDIANADNLSASMAGRYGSGSHQNILEKNIGDFATSQRFADYQTQQQRKDSAIRDYLGAGTTGFQQRGDAIGSLYNAGATQRANQLAGTGQMQDALNLRASPYDILGKIGKTYEGQNQALLNDKSRIFTEKKNALTDPVNWLANIAGAYKGGTTVENKSYNPLLQALGGAASGYDIFGGPVGGAVGGLAGLFG